MRSIPLILTLALAAAQGQQVRTPQGNFIPTSPPQQQQAQVPSDCAIDGSVVNALTGEPIVRAHVGMGAPTGASTVTDASGKWSLANVSCSVTQLMATRPGFLIRSRPSPVLVSGSPAHDVKLELTPQSVIYGKVVDDQGDPVMGVDVALLASRVAEGLQRFQRAGGAITNDLGEYRIASLARGKYIVCANQTNQMIGAAPIDGLVSAALCYPGPVEAGAASAMEIPAGRELKLDLTLNRVPAVHVRGAISGLPEGRGVGISLNPRNSIMGFGGSVSSQIRGGRFDFRVVPGAYTLMADYFEAGKHLSARVPVDVGNSDIDNLAATMEPGFAITGNLRVESQSQQAPRNRQFGINLRSSEPGGVASSVKWDADGASFAFNEVIPGTYRIETFPAAPFYVKRVTLSGQDILNSEFTVMQAAGPLEIVIADDGGGIEGDIVNADGQPASGQVIALRNGKATFAPVNPGGHFKLLNVPPGDYKVYAWDDAFQVAYADADWMRRYAGSGADVTVAAAQTAQVKLTVQNVPQ